MENIVKYSWISQYISVYFFEWMITDCNSWATFRFQAIFEQLDGTRGCLKLKDHFLGPLGNPRSEVIAKLCREMRPKPAARCCQSIPSWLNRDPNSIARLLDFRQLQLHDEYQGGCEPRSLSHGHLGDDPTGGDLVHHRVHLPGLALVEGMGGSWGSSVREIVGCKLEQKDQSCLLWTKR